MVNSIYENIIKDVDRVRIWMEALRCGSKGIHIVPESTDVTPDDFDSAMSRILSPVPMNGPTSPRTAKSDMAFFTAPERQKEQDLVEAIIDAIFYDSAEREFIRNDPLVRMLIPNEPGHYNFTLITAMGVITEGKKGMELQNAIERLEKERGIVTIRSDTGTARSFDYNASKIEEAAELAVQLNRPFGIVGYSQGCANEIHFESMMLSGELTMVLVVYALLHFIINTNCVVERHHRNTAAAKAHHFSRLWNGMPSTSVFSSQWQYSWTRWGGEGAQTHYHV